MSRKPALLMIAAAACVLAAPLAIARQDDAARPATEVKPLPLPSTVNPSAPADLTGTAYALSSFPPTIKVPRHAAPTDQALDPDAAALAAPVNDACATPQVIAGIGTFQYDNSMATQDGGAHALCNFFGSNQIDKDVWFRWTAPLAAQYVIETCAGSPFDTKVAVYVNAPCPPTNSSIVACNDDACSVQSRVTINALAGAQYLIRMGVYPGNSGGAGSFSISYAAGQTFCSQPATNCQAKNLTDAYLATNVVVADDFTPKTGGSITSICFWGTYYNGITDCQGQFPDRFVIKYRNDDGGTPDQFGVLRQFNPGQYTVVGPIPTGNLISGGFPEYAYVVTHAAVPVSANNCYWLEIENDFASGDCFWYWERGTGGNNYAYVNSLPAAVDMGYCFNIALDPPTECTTTTAPSNDTCATAMFVSPGQFIQADTRNATTSPDDPLFTCRFGGAAQGIGTVWFRFTTPSNITSAFLSLCENTTGDTLMALYSGTCGNLVQVACSDDFCGLRSRICATGLIPNRTYYVQVATRDNFSRGVYNLTLNLPCPAAVNDTCATAPLISLNAQGAGGASGNTFSATPDTNVPACDFTSMTSPSVWYRVVGTGHTMQASMCTSSFDTKLSVYCGTCNALSCVAHNDDSMICPPQSLLTWCTEPGRTYYILVQGFDGQVGEFVLNITRPNPNTCSGAAPCQVCDVLCQAGDIAEIETCGGTDNNGGCNLQSPVYQNIQCGQTVCGTASAAQGVRDTDWYRFTLTSPSQVTWEATGESPLEVFLLNDQCFPDQVIYATNISNRCGTATATAILEAGTYHAFVGMANDAYPCGSGSNDYRATLTCVPLGGCCTATDCFRASAAQCATAGGFYAGDGRPCPTVYTATGSCSAFENIASTGTPLAIAGETGLSIPLGFSFRFYGVDSTTIGVSANGYLTFGATLGSAANVPLPNAALPNALIAPFWDDLAPESAGTIRHQTLGAAGARRTIVQWTNVPRFLSIVPNTFQVVLYEGSNCIEFRYQSTDPAATPARGVENQTGNAGLTLQGLPPPNSCVRLCPMLPPRGCQSSCNGDANGDGMVTFLDVTTVLSNFAGVPPQGDADNNGVINFLDVTTVLANLGNTCP